MRRRFTVQPGEVSEFAKKGFLVKQRFIPQDLINEIVCLSNQLITRTTESEGSQPYIIGDLPFLEPRYTTLLASLNLWKAMASLLGSERLVYHYSSLLIKQPGVTSIVNWHRDFNNQYIAPIHSDYLRVFLPLSSFHQDSGAPKIIPGSHLLPDKATGLCPKGLPKQYPDYELLQCKPGDVVFLHPKLLHSSDSNISDSARVNLVMQIAKGQRPLRAIPCSEKYCGDNRLQLIHHSHRPLHC